MNTFQQNHSPFPQAGPQNSRQAGEQKTQRIPGTEHSLELHYDSEGRLLRLTGGGREYISTDNTKRRFDSGFAEFEEIFAAGALLRRVTVMGRSWTEFYRWDDQARPTEVDGMRLTRDDSDRVTGCEGHGQSWEYSYADDVLVHVKSHATERLLSYTADQKPAAVKHGDKQENLQYDLNGDRRAIEGTPKTWHRDEEGRLWAVSDQQGTILSTYLWDEFACLARIDGPPGGPIVEVYSLDLGGTPVRVATAENTTIIPRDLFGENLTAHAGVPGLFGGAQHKGMVYFAYRSYDPKLGLFNSPDPLDGSAEDPRREEGFTGTLIAEKATAAGYGVCGYDTYTYCDPTGAIAWYYLLSSLTWAFPNNWFLTLGMDWTINFWGSLFSGNIGRFFNFRHIHSDRLNVGGVLRDGVMASERAFATQHYIWEQFDSFDQAKNVMVCAPGDRFLPGYYGTTLRMVENSSSRAFMLRGMRRYAYDGDISNDYPAGWTRHGGEAEAIAPGVLTPHFPGGGLHLGDMFTESINCTPTFRPPVQGPTDATIVELEPLGPIGVGTANTRVESSVPEHGLGLSENDWVGMADPSNRTFVTQIRSAVEESNGTTTLQFNPDPTGLDTAELRLRGLEEDRTTENLTNMTDPNRLETTGSSEQYAVGDYLHLRQGSDDRGFSFITALEARVQLDAAFTGPPGWPGAEVLPVVTSGSVNTAELTASGTDINFPDSPRPSSGDLIRVFDGTNDIAVVVGAETGNQRAVDRSLAVMGGTGTSVSWQNLTAGGSIGIAATFDITAQLTFAPEVVRTAPSSGFLAVRRQDDVVQVRRVTSRDHDAIVLGPAKTGIAADYSVELFKAKDPNATDMGIRTVFQLAAPLTTTGAVALQIHQLTNDTLAANLGGTSLAGFSLNAETLSQPLTTYNANELRPSQVIALDDGSNQEVALIRSVVRDVLLDRDLPIPSATTDLRAVLLETTGVNYSATRISNSRLVVLPNAFGATTRLEMPRFFEGELVEVQYSAGGTQNDQFRVTAVSGTRLTLAFGRADLPAGASDFRVRKLAVADPDTGGGYIAINGAPSLSNLGGANTRILRFHLWNWSNLTNTERIGIIHDGQTLPARIRLQTAYDCTQADPNPEILSVASSVGGSTTGISMPQFVVGERVEAAWDPSGGGGRQTELFNVSAVSGSVVTVLHDGGAGMITAGASNITLRHLGTLDINLGAAPASASGTIAIRTLAHSNNNIWAPGFTAETGQTIVLAPDITGTLTPGNRQVVVIPLRELGTPAAAVMEPGGVLVPEDPENWEHNRYQSLVEHELRHTEQYLWWGPLWFTAFPLWAFDLGFSYAADVDLPRWSAFVAATIERDSNNNAIRLLRIPNAEGIEFGDNSHVQIFRGSLRETAEFNAERASDLFQIKPKASGETALPDGPVFVRKLNSALGPSGQDWYSGIYQVFDTLTPGGLLNILFGAGYGSMMLLLVRIPWMIAKACSTYTRHAVTVLPSRNELQLSETGRRSEYTNERRVIIRQNGQDDFVRTLSSVDESGKLTLGSSLGFEGAAEVSPYDTSVDSQYWYWQKYYPAIVKADSFASITAQEEDGDRLEVSTFDRLHIIGEKNSNHERFTLTTTVTAVSGNDIELTDALPTDALGSSDQVLRVAKIGRQDSQGHVESLFLDQYGLMGPMRWVSDPFRQMHLRNIEEPGSAWEIISRIARYIWGTHNWSLGLPGHVFFDRLFPGDDVAYLSDIEQDSSNQSGDLYSALGRLRGDVNIGDGFNATMVLGDIARYWYWPNPRTTMFPTQAGWCNSNYNQDVPGVNTRPAVCVMPFVTAESGDAAPGNGAEPNNNATAGAVGTQPGLAVADVFSDKNPGTPEDVPGGGGPRRIMASNRGWIPTSKTLGRTQGMYVAFTTPTTGADRHRVTTDNGILQAAEARHAQDEGKQKLLYNVNVTDVTVMLNGIAVSEGMTINLLKTQRARFVCTPNNNRRYRLTVLRPADGAVVRRSDELEIDMQAAAANSSEPVEISRYYRFDPSSGQFETGGLMQHGVHLPTDIDVAVRRLTVNTVDTPIVLNNLADAINFGSYGGTIPSLTPGAEVFVFIAASILNFNPVIGYPGTPAIVHASIIQADRTSAAPDTSKAFLGTGANAGGVFSLSIDANDPPEEEAHITVDVSVGAAASPESLTQITIPITGHFLATSGGAYTAAAGGTITLDCANVGGGGVTPDPATVVVTMPDGSAPAEVSPGVPELTFAAGGPNQLVVTVNPGFSGVLGNRRLLIEESGNTSNKARRTIILT